MTTLLTVTERSGPRPAVDSGSHAGTLSVPIEATPVLDRTVTA
jgi:hypothetical protein